MNLRFLCSSPGRIACGTFGFAAVAAGVLAIVGPGSYTFLAIPFIILACIVGSIFATGLAIEEFWGEALGMILVLPFLGGPYLVGLFVVGKAGAVSGTALLLIGLLGILFAALGFRYVAGGRVSSAHEASEPAPARVRNTG